jgi:hypothetical protein
VSADSIVPRPGNPQSLNRYTYVLNRPLQGGDPTGHDGPPEIDLTSDLFDWISGLADSVGESINYALTVVHEEISFQAGDVARWTPSYQEIGCNVDGCTNGEWSSIGLDIGGAITEDTPLLDETSFHQGYRSDPYIIVNGQQVEFQSAIVLEAGPYRGGRYGNLDAGPGIERHHMPADSVSPYSRNQGLAIQMDTPGHKQTASWGNSRDARAYRNAQQELIDQGRIDDAIQMDIDDVTSKFDNKYVDAILEAIDSPR